MRIHQSCIIVVVMHARGARGARARVCLTQDPLAEVKAELFTKTVRNLLATDKMKLVSGGGARRAQGERGVDSCMCSRNVLAFLRPFQNFRSCGGVCAVSQICIRAAGLWAGAT